MRKDKRDKITKYIIGQWTSLKLERQAREATWHECEMAWLSQFADDTEIADYRSQRYIPLIWQAVNSVYSQMMSAAFPGDYFASARGDNPEAERHVHLRTMMMRSRIDKMAFAERYGPHLLQLLLFGSSAYIREWTSAPSRRRVHKYDYASGEEERTYQAKSHEYDGPDFRHADIFNFVIDMRGRDMNSALKIYRTIVPKQEIRDGVEEGLYTNCRLVLKEKDVATEASDSLKAARLATIGVNEPVGVNEDKIELHLFHGDFEVDGKFYADHMGVVANRKYLIQLRPNPYHCGQTPLGYTSLAAGPQLSYKQSLVEPALPLVDLVNIRSNQVTDAMALIVNPIWKAKDDGVMDLDNIISEPGHVIDMADTDNLVALRPDMTTLQAFGEINALKEEVMDTMSAHQNAGANKSRETATSVAISASMMGAVTSTLVHKLERLDIEPTLAFFDELEKQFFDPMAEDPTFVRFEDGGQIQFEQITPEVIYQHYTWKAQGSGFTHLKEVRLQQLHQWGQLMMTTPAQMSVDWDEVGRASLNDMGRRDADKLLPGSKEMQNRAQEEPAAAAGIMGGAGQSQGGPGIPGMAPLGRGAIPNAGGGPPTG